MSFYLKALAALAVTARAAPLADNSEYDFNACHGSNTAPEQIHLAYASDRGMTVSWNTPSHLSRPTVRFGSSKWNLNRYAWSDVSVTYPTSTTFSNHVTLTELQPDTVYYYVPQCGDVRNPYSFKTSRPAGKGEPFVFAYVADLGTMGADGLTTHVGTGAANPLKPGETNTIQSLTQFKSSYDFLWHSGDLAYADYWLKEEIQGFLPNTTIADGAKVYERILNDFYNEMTAVTVDRPYMVGPGNHEANCDNGGTSDKAHNVSYTVSICMPGQTNFTGYRNHFRMPSAQSGGVENFWYSFDYGMVHFIQFNTETDFPNAPDLPGGEGKENAGPFAPTGAQLAWLQRDLSRVDRQKTPWVIAAGHRPWYVSGGKCAECQSAFEPLLVQYGVDLVLFGHDHVYERNAPVGFNGTADPRELNNPKAPWYITNGAAGHYDGLDTFDSPMETYSRRGILEYGWSRFTVHNCTHLTTEFIASGNGTVLDTATLFKNRRCEVSGGYHGKGGYW